MGGGGGGGSSSLPKNKQKPKPVHDASKCCCSMSSDSDEKCKNAPSIKPQNCNYPKGACAVANDENHNHKGQMLSWTLNCICGSTGESDILNRYRGCVKCQFDSNGGFSPGWKPHDDCLDWVCPIWNLKCADEIGRGFNGGVKKCIDKESPTKGSIPSQPSDIEFIDCKDGQQKVVPSPWPKLILVPG